MADQDSPADQDPVPSPDAAQRARIARRGAARGRFAKNSGLLLITALLARVVGLARDTLIADKFGASGLTDGYFVANILPTFLQGVMSRALDSVVVPTISQDFASGRSRHAYAVVAALSAYLGAALAVFILAVNIFAPQLVALIAPGMHGVDAAVAVRLTRILSWTVAFSAYAFLAAAVMVANEKFVFMSIGPVFMSGAATVVLLSQPNPPIALLAIGLVIGNALQLAFQLVPNAVRWRDLPSLREVRLGDPAVKQSLRLAWPAMIAGSVGQVNVLVDRYFGSMLHVGSISEVTYASKIVQLPLAMFGYAVANASYPEMSRAYSDGRMGDLKSVMIRDLRVIMLLTMAATALFVALAGPIISAVYQHGKFSDAEDAVVVSSFLYYTATLVPSALRTVMTRGFFIAGNTRTLANLSIWMVVLNAAGDGIFSRIIGAPGLALGTAIDQWISIVATFYYLQKILPTVPLRETIDAFVRSLPGSAAMAGAALGTADLLAAHNHWLAAATLGRPILVVIAACVGIIFGAAGYWVTRYPGLTTVVAMVLKVARIRR